MLGLEFGISGGGGGRGIQVENLVVDIVVGPFLHQLRLDALTKLHPSVHHQLLLLSMSLSILFVFLSPSSPPPYPLPLSLPLSLFLSLSLSPLSPCPQSPPYSEHSFRRPPRASEVAEPQQIDFWRRTTFASSWFTLRNQSMPLHLVTPKPIFTLNVTAAFGK
jgi:hypothetical protein